MITTTETLHVVYCALPSLVKLNQLYININIEITVNNSYLIVVQKHCNSVIIIIIIIIKPFMVS